MEALNPGSPLVGCNPFPKSPPGAGANGRASPFPSVVSAERCGEHGEVLSMFCLDDLEPLCNQCGMDESHAGHRVYSLTEAAADCKAELRASLEKLNKRMPEFEEVSQTCEHVSRYNQAEVKRTEERMRKEFEMLHSFLREEEEARLHTLREEEEEKKLKVNENVECLDQVIKCLEEKIQLVEEALETEGVEDFLQNYQDTMESSTWKSHKEPNKGCGLLIDVARHLGNIQYGVWEKMKHIAPYTPVLLDSRTAGQSLILPAGLNSIKRTNGLERGEGGVPPVPDNPERFNPYSCVLGSEGFNSGIHCWDVEVGNSNNWTIGVAGESVCRKKEFEACPEAGLWCISLREGKYEALTFPPQILYIDGGSDRLKRVGVRLDCTGGTLDFMNADTDTLLFTFRDCCTEKVYPYFETISVWGGLATSAQEVKVRVEADPVQPGGTATPEEDRAKRSTSSADNPLRGHPAEENKSFKSEEKRAQAKDKTSTSKNQLIQTKSTGKEKTANKNQSGRKQPRKARFSLSYHVCLNTAQKAKDQQI